MQPHITANAGPRQVNFDHLPDNPSFEFRGGSLHVDDLPSLMEMTGKEVVLYLLVDAFTRSGGVGCYATNGQLAELLKTDERQVKRMIEHLTDLGLIVREPAIVRYGRERRVITTNRSRSTNPGGVSKTPPPRASNTPHKEDSLRSSSKQTQCVSPDSDSSLRSPPPSKRRHGARGEPMSDYAASSIPPLMPTQQTTPQSPTCTDWANRLHETAVKHHRYTKRWSASKWADEFRLLLADCDNDTARVELVVAWYENNAATEKYPIKSAAAFRQRFFKDLEDKALGKWGPTTTKGTPKSITITDDAHEIVGELREWADWPKGSDEQLPAAVQASLDAAIPIAQAWRGLHGTLDGRDGSDPHHGAFWVLRRFYEDIQGKSAKRIVRAFMKYQYRWLSKWASWSGDLMKFTLSAQSKHLADMITKVAIAEAGSKAGARHAKFLMEKANESAS